MKLTKYYELNILGNGSAYGFGFFHSLFDFFFPFEWLDKILYGRQLLRHESGSGDLFSLIHQRSYSTFRAWAWDWWYEFVVNPFRSFSLADALGISREFAYQLGAIALDTTANIIDVGNTPQSASYTCTGTNRYLMLAGLADTTATFTSFSYNSVNATLIATKQKTAGNTYTIGMYGQGNPASGANTATLTTSTGLVRAAANSYSGAQQTDAADSSGTNENTSATTLTVSTTVVATNCWLIGLFFNNQAEAKTAGAGTTARSPFVQTPLSSSQGMTCDSNATVGTGSQSLVGNGNGAAADWVGIAMSIAPSAAVVSGGIMLRGYG